MLVYSDKLLAFSVVVSIQNHHILSHKTYISYSGGKDSTVLLDLVRKVIPDIPIVFSNTGLEYPEIRMFAESKGAIKVQPEMNFHKVISTYGYPIISKEVSEAIYYARRIIPSDRERIQGGNQKKIRTTWKTPIRKRKELLGQRTDDDGYG